MSIGWWRPIVPCSIAIGLGLGGLPAHGVADTVRMAQATAPQAKAPQAEAPQAKAPQAKGPQAKEPQATAPQAKAPQAKEPQAKPPQATQQAVPVVMPSAKQIVLLTRTALLTLNDAMQTGNYTVLHDAGAPSFRDANPPGRLAQIFSTLVARRVDLTLVAVMVPEIREALLDQEARLLRLAGSFPTRPMQTDFVLIFQEVSGHWRLFGISVDTSPVPAATGQATGKPPANVAAGAGQGKGPPILKRNPGAVR